ncbi:hypothetical protein LOAG_18262 [Loa loa]|uniref:Uncharacterized protein n=1 Tax=Loa loa TaxID=7209 RepID=A0A1S0UFU1_LOALO|nr:hypothetical protein LOAG_18262 [Loa loa]EJD74423.1 hypothetical protein LOAG_18262 [Loa loa]
MKRILMNSLQKLEFQRLLNREMCKEKLSNLPDDVLCTEEAHNRNVCLTKKNSVLSNNLSFSIINDRDSD